MRPLRLEITAFGPFGDSVVVDFDRLPNDRPFIISGPTGAGKTTLFDAMCFALYGGLPGQRKGHTEVRSSFASEQTIAEVAFEFELNGLTYRVERIPKQTRAKKTGTGTTEEPGRANLYRRDASEWVSVASKIRDVEAEIEDLLGIDAELFQRSVLLPQGEFQRVLHASTDERRNLLRALFGTDLYERAVDNLKRERAALRRELAAADAVSQDRRSQVTRQIADASASLVDAEPAEEADQVDEDSADGAPGDPGATGEEHDDDNVIDLRSGDGSVATGDDAAHDGLEGVDDHGVRTAEWLRSELEDVWNGRLIVLSDAADAATGEASTARRHADAAQSQAAEIADRDRLAVVVEHDQQLEPERMAETERLDRAERADPVVSAAAVAAREAEDLVRTARVRANACQVAAAAAAGIEPIGAVHLPELDTGLAEVERAVNHLDAVDAKALAEALGVHAARADALAEDARRALRMSELVDASRTEVVKLDAESTRLTMTVTDLERQVLELTDLRAEVAATLGRRDVAQQAADAASRRVQLASELQELHQEISANEAAEVEATARLDAAEAELDGLRTTSAELAELASTVPLTERSLQDATARHATLEEVRAATASLEGLQVDAAEAVEEAESAFAAYVATEAPRLAEGLVEDEPCPVCGGLEHPNPAMAPADLEVVDRESVTSANQRAEAASTRVITVRNKIADILQRDPGIADADPDAVAAAVVSASARHSDAVGAAEAVRATDEAVGHAEAVIRRIEAELVGLAAQRSRSEASIAGHVGALGEHAAHALEELQLQESAAEADLAVVEEAGELLRRTDQQIELSRGQVEQHSSTLSAAKDRALGLRTGIQGALGEIAEIDSRLATELGDRVPDELAADMRDAAALVLVARDAMLVETDAGVRSASARDTTDGALATAGFTALSEALDAAIAVDERRRRRRELADLQARVAIDAGRLAELQAKSLPERAPDVDELDSRADLLGSIAADLQERVASANALLTNARTSLDDLAASERDISGTRDRHALVSRVIAVLSGSATQLNVPLEAWVLAAHLREVVVAANVHLRQMSHDRYELEVADPTGKGNSRSGLDLAVRDARTGVARATRSLSGGETFLASLALALGLADVAMAGKAGIHLDALFIDEGFGSLDAEAVDMAIGVLDGLRSRGAMVGVITHVDAVKEALPVALKVTGRPDGRGSMVTHVA